LSFSPRAVEKLDSRELSVPSWYLDMTMIRDYWGANRRYHHTAPINMVYSLHAGLKQVLEEGLENRWERHRKNAEALWAGLGALGWDLFVEEDYRLIPLTTVKPPEDVDEKELRGKLLNDFGIEIGGGLGPLAGKVVRIGLMGTSSTAGNLKTFLSAVEKITGREDGAGVAAAEESLAG
jgi:alanine-glyoxylate transaminase/serine-glyoxylate transaminase/serine-pyruvate transaminase